VVREAIPESCYRISTGRTWWTVGQAGLLHVVPLVVLAATDVWWILLPMWLLAGLGVAGLFVLGHDASHGASLHSARANRVLARLCMLPSAHVEAAWDLGHNRIHHGYTARQGFDFIWHPLTGAEYAQLGRLARLRHRVEWSWVGAGVYYGRTVWWQKMVRFNAPESRRRQIHGDKRFVAFAVGVCLALCALLGWRLGGAFGAVWMPVKLLVVPFLLFLQIIGWTVYVHHVSPDIRWWPSRQWTRVHGQLESTTILRMPRLANRLWFHNIFVHVPHHVDTRIPFHQLPLAAQAITDAYPDIVKHRRFSIVGYLRAAAVCKLYDFDAGRWLPYSSATTPR
jgi:omega-6 fatty acid desaturase (delta-12 desaturase)